MPRILVDVRVEDRETVIDKIETIARKIFGPNGIIPIKPGGVEIIPAFGSLGGHVVRIFLYKKEERTETMLWKMITDFQEFIHESIDSNCTVFFDDLPENLWRKF